MTEQLSYNPAELFEGIKAFEQNLLFMEKGQRKYFVLAMPSEYNGKLKAIVPVQGYFKGQPNKNPSILIRCFEIPLHSNGNPDFDNAKFVGLVTNAFVASKLQESFQPSTMLVKRPNLLPDAEGKAFLFMLQRPDKNTEITFSSVSIKIPDSIYNMPASNWSDLVDEFNSMQQALLKKQSTGTDTKEENKDVTPWG